MFFNAVPFLNLCNNVTILISFKLILKNIFINFNYFLVKVSTIFSTASLCWIFFLKIFNNFTDLSCFFLFNWADINKMDNFCWTILSEFFLNLLKTNRIIDDFSTLSIVLTTFLVCAKFAIESKAYIKKCTLTLFLQSKALLMIL